MATRVPVAAHEPRRRGRLRPLPRPARRAASSPASHGCRPSCGASTRAVRGLRREIPWTAPGAVGVRPRARAGRPAAGRRAARRRRARAGRRPARLRRSCCVRHRLPAPARAGGARARARRLPTLRAILAENARGSPLRGRCPADRRRRLRHPQRAGLRDRAARRTCRRPGASGASAGGRLRARGRAEPREARRPLVHRRRVPTRHAARLADRRLAARRRAAGVRPPVHCASSCSTAGTSSTAC